MVLQQWIVIWVAEMTPWMKLMSAFEPTVPER